LLISVLVGFLAPTMAGEPENHRNAPSRGPARVFANW
jgi:hypothetical protein